MVTLDKTGKKSFGICIVRGEVKDSPNTKTTGIFIKGIVPESPAHLCGRLKVGDRILSLNGKDVRHSTEQAVIDLIKEADFKIDLEIQTHDKSDDQHQQQQQQAKGGDPRSNGYMQAKNKFNQDQTPSNNAGGGQGMGQGMNQGMGQGQGMNRQQTLQKRNTTFTASMRQKYSNAEEDDEDTRDMTGRIRTEAGYEVGF